MSEHEYEGIRRPLLDHILKLEDTLRRSPTYLMVKDGDAVREVVGYGDRIMALEVQRLRDALEKIAKGEVADKDVGAFAWATLDP